MDKKYYISGGKKYAIPNEKSEAFISKFPDAQEAKYYDDVEGKKYYIPLDKVESFESKFNIAQSTDGGGAMGKSEGSQEPLEQSQDTTTTSSSETPSPTSKSPYDIRSNDVVIDDSGEPSTVKMATETFDGKNWHSFPTLFPKDPDNQTNNPDDWISYDDPKEAYDEAKKRGEVWDFNEDKDSAMAFGKGSWKKPTSEQSGEGIDLDYFISQAPKATDTKAPKYNETSGYDEYLSMESKLRAKLEEKGKLEQAAKTRSYGDDPNFTANYDPLTNLNEQKNKVSDEVDVMSENLAKKVDEIITPQLLSVKSDVYDSDGKVKEYYLSENVYGFKVPNLDKLNEYSF